MFKNRKPAGKKGGQKKSGGSGRGGGRGGHGGMPHGMPPEMAAAFAAAMGADDDFDEEDFDDEDLEDMEAEFESAFGGCGGRGRGGQGKGDSGSSGKSSKKRDLYEVLGVERSATTEQIKKAFRVAAVKHHPDKGGDPELFKEMSEAYAILGDEDKRAKYDKYGHDAPEDDDDGRGGRGPSKPKPVQVVLPVTLAEIYNGVVKKVRVERHRTCDTCSGSGSRDPNAAPQRCQQCRGQGVVLARSFIGVMQMECDACDGTGQFVSARNRCGTCKGEKIVEQAPLLEVTVPRGAPDGDRIVLAGEGHKVPSLPAGDVVVVLKTEKHESMTRFGDALVVNQTITLADSLCGCDFEFQHLDGRRLRIRTQRGQVIAPGSLKCVEHEGMPRAANAFFKGHLVFRFQVTFPDQLAEVQVKAIEDALGHREKAAAASSAASPAGKKDKKEKGKGKEAAAAAAVAEADEFFLSDFKEALDEKKHAYGRSSDFHRHDDDDDDDEIHMGAGGPNVGCRQM